MVGAVIVACMCRPVTGCVGHTRYCSRARSSLLATEVPICIDVSEWHWLGNIDLGDMTAF